MTQRRTKRMLREIAVLIVCLGILIGATYAGARLLAYCIIWFTGLPGQL